MDINVTNLAAAIINDKRYSELKTAVYEGLVKHDHASIVAVFRALQEYAEDAEDNSFTSSDRPKKTPIRAGSHDLDFDPDMDESLSAEEISLRK